MIRRGACRAERFQTLPQQTPCSVKPHVQVVAGDTQLLRHLPGILTLKIYFLNKQTVRFFQGRKQRTKALANQGGIFVGDCFLFSHIGLMDTLFAGALALRIHNSMLHNAVKPRHQFFSASEAWCRLQCLEQAVLQDIFGPLWIGYFVLNVLQQTLTPFGK